MAINDNSPEFRRETRTRALNLALMYQRQHCIYPNREMTKEDIVNTADSFLTFLEGGSLKERAEAENGRTTSFGLKTKKECNEVMAFLDMILVRESVVTLSDLYELIGIQPTWHNQKMGWKTLAGFSIERLDDGWFLVMPNPEKL